MSWQIRLLYQWFFAHCCCTLWTGRWTTIPSTHPLRPLLPPERSTPYCTHPWPHNYELPSKINNIDECNFMYHVLYNVFSCFLACQYVLHCVYSGLSVDCFNKDYHPFYHVL